MRRPLVPLALAAVVGAVLALALEISPWVPAVAGTFAVVAAIPADGRARVACLSAASLALAWSRGEVAWRHPDESDLSRRLSDEPTLARVRGRVVVPPVVLDRDIDRPPRRSTFLLDATEIELGDGTHPASGRVLVRIADVAPRLEYGADVRCEARLRRPSRPRSPGATDPARMLRARGVRVVADCETWANVRVIEDAARWHPLRWIGCLRSRFAQALDDSLPEPEAALAIALLLGERRDFPPELRERFQRCGTIHVFAISGAHVVVLAGLVRFVLALALGSRPRLLAALLLMFVAIYTVLAGAAPSVLRAAWMVAIYVGADLVGRRRDPLHALAASLFLLVMLDPPDVTDVGFQLSFVSVASLILLVPKPGPHVRPWLKRPLEALGLSAAATFGTTPLVLWHFNLLAPVSMLANVAISIPAAAALALGMAFLVASLVAPFAIPATAYALGLSLDVLVAVPTLFEKLPAAWLYLPTPPIAGVLAGYAILSITAWRARGRALASIGGGGLSCVVVLASIFARPAPPTELAVLDVGQGSCVYVQLASGATVLYDAGSSGYPEVAGTIVAPFLWNRAIRRIDWLVLSHEDADHVNAAVAIAERFTIGAVAVSASFGGDATSEGARALRRLESLGIPVHRLSRGDSLDVSGSSDLDDVRVLHPPIVDPGRRIRVSDNDASLSLLVTTGGVRLLLTGDLQESGCETLLASGFDLRCDFLLVPHHGARCAELPRLLEATRPLEALVSARRGFPAPSTIEALESCGARWSATYREGTITRRLDRDPRLTSRAR